MAPSDWTVETLNAVTDSELDDLPADMRARFVRICELIAAVSGWIALAYRMSDT